MGAHVNPEWLNIDSVVNNDLCTQCGACVAMCPHDNIVITRDEHWRFYPKVQELDPCVNHCKSLCVNICSGVHEDSSLWKKQPIVERDYDEFCTGPVLQAWIGYSTDRGIRSRGTSGGLITGLLVYLLESGKIDGALIVGPNNSHPLQHDIMIARTRAEIESSWGSKYYPMPIGHRFDELIHKTERFAVVLLGCHMRALRLMERRIPQLRKSVVMRIGIICGYCSGFKATVDQAREWGVKDLYQITRIDYRDGKWPGNVHIRAAPVDKQRVIYEFLTRLPFTTNHRCMICSDLMNETADITLGDAWLKELTTRKDEGWSVMAVRNPAVIPLIEAARADGALYLEEVDTETFIRSQEKPMRYKKHALKVRLWFVRKVMRRSIPNNNFDRFADGFKANVWNWIGNVAFMITMWTFFKRDRLRRAMYRTVPRKWIDWYVRSIFLMIAHDGRSYFLVKWLFRKDPAMNCDA
jgi:coenzyme F420 hydrogenase subunit beta